MLITHVTQVMHATNNFGSRLKKKWALRHTQKLETFREANLLNYVPKSTKNILVLLGLKRE